jgi:hypothetical protein
MDENELRPVAPLPPGHQLTVSESEEPVEPTVDDEDIEMPRKSNSEVAREVVAGLWGTGQDRRQALADEGYDPNEIKREIVKLLNERNP